AFANRLNWHSKVQSLFQKLKYQNIIAIIGILLLIVFHGFFPNFIVAPFTALGFIFLFLQIEIQNFGNKLLDYFTPHATNLWLIHMFFYMIYFPKLIYGFKYVPLIFLALVFSCIISSYIVN